MTIELLSLDDVPPDLAGSARTLVAVPGPNGPLRYKAPLTQGAPLSSPAFTDNPTAPTPTLPGGIANKAYVDTAVAGAAGAGGGGGAAPSSSTPLANAGAGSAGTSATVSRSDHVHPTDTSRLAAASNLADLACATAPAPPWR